MKKLVLLTYIMISICAVSSATVLIVNNNYNIPGQYQSLQTAVDSANTGDTIYVVGSPNSYGSFSLAFTNKTFVFIGAGYRPQKDFNSSSKINDIGAGNISLNGNNIKIFGFEIFGTIGKDPSSCCGGNDWEIAYNKFSGNNSIIRPGDNCNIHDNYFEIGSNGGGEIIFQGANPCEIHNNIFSRLTGNNGVLLADHFAFPFNSTGNLIYNNHFLSASGGNVFGYVYNSTIENNLFYGYYMADTNSARPQNCTFNASLTNYPFAIFGDNVTSFPNYFGLLTLPQFQNPNTLLNGAFDFPPYDYSLKSTSIGYNGGTAGTEIGAFGGTNPFGNFTGMHASLPQIIKLDLANAIIGVNDPLVFHATGYANAGDSIIDAAYFFDVDSNGTSFPLTITGATFDVTIPITHGIAASASEHIFGIRVKSSNGIWSHPEMRTFRVCAVSGALPHFDAYVSGYNVILQNNSTDQHSCIWTFGDGSFSTDTNRYLVHHYDTAGVFNLCLDANNPCTYPPLSNNQLCKTITVKGINSISPAKGGNIGVVTMTITGAGFNNSTTVKLVKAGESDVIPLDSSTVVAGGINILTVFDLKGIALGKWDVIVNVPGDTTFIVVEGFEVDSGIAPTFSTDLIGPTIVRRGRWNNYSLKVKNSGNVDGFLIPIWFAVPSDLQVNLKFKYKNPPDTLVPILWDTVSPYVFIDTLFGEIGHFKLYGFNIPYIGGLNEVALDLELQSGILGNKKFSSWLSPPLIYSDSLQFNRYSTISNSVCVNNTDAIDCSLSIAGILAPCIGSFAAWLYQYDKDLLCKGYRNVDYKSENKNLAMSLMYCTGNPYIWYAGFLLSTATAAERGCFGSTYHPRNINNIGAVDPNNKFGSTSVYNSIYLNSDKQINYKINFENVDTATASAQTVIVVDTLNKINLDLSTFQLTQVGFGDTMISVPAGKKSFTTDIDLRPNIPLIARVAAFLNESTGVFISVFTSLDTLTMEPTTDPLLGFLLPNDSTGRGEGSVSYSIKAKNNIATGIIINNKADIYFDNNAPVTTQIWTNIIDNLKPQSQVTSLTQIANTDSVIVHWTGTDNGPAGLYAYNVYYQMNSNPWTLWKYNTSLTNDTFVGTVDSTYGFYSIAIDSALNIEDAPLTADATTMIVTGLNEINQSQMIVKLFPNPANNAVNIYIRRFDNGKNDFNIIARDITGRTIRNEKVNLGSGSITHQVDISQFVNGVYFFEITDETNRIFKKLIKN